MIIIRDQQVKELGDFLAEMDYIPWPYQQSSKDWDKPENKCETCDHRTGNSEEEITDIRNDIIIIIEKVREILR